MNDGGADMDENRISCRLTWPDMAGLYRRKTGSRPGGEKGEAAEGERARR